MRFSEKTTSAFRLMPSAHIEASNAEINKDREGLYFRWKRQSWIILRIA
jgi:hypothetical protein